MLGWFFQDFTYFTYALVLPALVVLPVALLVLVLVLVQELVQELAPLLPSLLAQPVSFLAPTGSPLT